MHTINKYIKAVMIFVLTFGFTVNLYSQSAEESSVENFPLPSVLFKKHIEAIGEEQSIKAHTTKTIKGKMTIKIMGIEGTMNVVAEAPNKIKTTVELGQYGKSLSGYDGNVGYSVDPMQGNRILEGEALEQMIARADFYGNDIHLGIGAVKQETIQLVNIEDGEYFKVLLVDTEGEESFLYFSKETGLLSGIDMMELSATGKTPTQIRMNNYVETAGIKTAHKITSKQNGVETIIQIDSVSYEPLAENAFELPTEIQSLVTK